MRNRANRERKAAALLAAVLAGSACAGCVQQPETRGIGYCLPRPRDLTRIHRVVVLELDYGGKYPRLPQKMTEALAGAMRERMIFQVDLDRSGDPELGELARRATSNRTLKDLSALREAVQCDAVLIGSIRRYEPYPRMQMALNLQLLDLRRGRLVWGLDHSWDTADRATERRIKEFFRTKMRKDYGPLDWRLAVLSPRAFEKFVASEAAGTLRRPDSPAETRKTIDADAVLGGLRKTLTN